MRLSDIEDAYGDQVEIHWRAFPLIPDDRPGRRSTPHTAHSRRRAGAEEPRAHFALPPADIELPSSSLPALTAAKAAERQGSRAFATLHRAVFAAHFGDNADISRPDVLWLLAQSCGLDMMRFERDCASGEPHQDVLRDYAEAVAWFGVSALPTVIFNEKISLVGAVPVEQYRLLLDWMLAGQPGGVIPLDFSEAASSGTTPVTSAG